MCWQNKSPTVGIRPCPRSLRKFKVWSTADYFLHSALCFFVLWFFRAVDLTYSYSQLLHLKNSADMWVFNDFFRRIIISSNKFLDKRSLALTEQVVHWKREIQCMPFSAWYTDNVTVRVGLHHIMHCWVWGQSSAFGLGLTPDPAVHYMV